MKEHPTTRAHRRKLARLHKEERDAFGEMIDPTDRYTPRSKNTPYCPASHKDKLQFATKEAAERYIAYNADRIYNIKGKAPIRAYFCPSCRCWHVTSKAERFKYSA